MEIGQQISIKDIQPVRITREGLSKRVFDLQNEGATALGIFPSLLFFLYFCVNDFEIGPALTIAVAIAAQAASSEVIVSTDGESNMGVGMTTKSGGDVAHYRKVPFKNTKQIIMKYINSNIN